MPSWPIDTTVVADDYIATLPHLEAQALLGARGPIRSTGRLTTCSWHGTAFDPRLGSFAVVQIGSDLEDLLGERVKVTSSDTARSVYAWVCDVKDTDEPISLTRRCFIDLAPPATDALAVVVEVAG
jgi:hypothetical protein